MKEVDQIVKQETLSIVQELITLEEATAVVDECLIVTVVSVGNKKWKQLLLNLPQVNVNVLVR